MLVALGLCAGMSGAYAVPVSTTPQSYAFALNVSEIRFVGTIDDSATNAFNKFDSSLGTLQQVVFRWSSPLTAIGTVTPANATLDTSTFTVTVGASLVGLGSLFSRTFSDELAPPSANITETVAGNRTYSAAGDLSYFIGSGTFNADLTLTATVVSVNNSDSMSADWGTQTNRGNLTLEYIYEARSPGQIPEPGVLCLGAIAALALGAAARNGKLRR